MARPPFLRKLDHRFGCRRGCDRQQCNQGSAVGRFGRYCNRRAVVGGVERHVGDRSRPWRDRQWRVRHRQGDGVTSGATGQNVAIGSSGTTANSGTAGGGAVAIGRGQAVTAPLRSAIRTAQPARVRWRSAQQHVGWFRCACARQRQFGERHRLRRAGQQQHGKQQRGGNRQLRERDGHGAVAIGNSATATGIGAIARHRRQLRRHHACDRRERHCARQRLDGQRASGAVAVGSPPWPRTTMRRPSARTRLRRVRVRSRSPKRECNDHQRHRHRRRLDRERRKLGCARQQLGNEQHRVDDDGRQHRRQQHHDRRPDVRQLPSRDADGRHCQRRSG